jgi:hypothetical protein
VREFIASFFEGRVYTGIREEFFGDRSLPSPRSFNIVFLLRYYMVSLYTEATLGLASLYILASVRSYYD